MTDLTIKCIDCGNEFIFTDGEQVFYKLKELFPPKRCAWCRKNRREQKMTAVVTDAKINCPTGTKFKWTK